mgnify:CR=1 FL=1
MLTKLIAHKNRNIDKISQITYDMTITTVEITDYGANMLMDYLDMMKRLILSVKQGQLENLSKLDQNKEE